MGGRPARLGAIGLSGPGAGDRAGTDCSVTSSEKMFNSSLTYNQLVRPSENEGDWHYRARFDGTVCEGSNCATSTIYGSHPYIGGPAGEPTP